jgi:hypothetical protein
VPRLLLHEQRIGAVFDQVRNVRMTQAVHRQLARQPGRGPPGREPVIDLPGRDPPAPLGQPQRRVAARRITRPDLADVLRQRLGRPRHHSGHRPPPRRAAPHRLAIPDMAHPQPAQLRSGRVDREIGHVQHRRLPAAQPPPVDHLEQRRVAERGQPPLARRCRRPLDVIISRIQERLQLGPGQRPPLRPALVLGRVHRGVALMAHLDRAGADLLLTLRDPAIPGIAHVTEEDRQRAPSYERTVECAHPPEAIQSSTCAGVHCHGQAPVNSANRRTSRTRPSTSGPNSRRAPCWRRQPSSIASNNAGSGRSGTAPPTSTSAAEPTALRVPATAPPKAQASDATNKASDATRSDVTS